eukprot:1232608-Amphidinium_carterae.1
MSVECTTQLQLLADFREQMRKNVGSALATKAKTKTTLRRLACEDSVRQSSTGSNGCFAGA